MVALEPLEVAAEFPGRVVVPSRTLRLPRIDEVDLEAAALKQFEQRNPVHAGRTAAPRILGSYCNQKLKRPPPLHRSSRCRRASMRFSGRSSSLPLS